MKIYFQTQTYKNPDYFCITKQEALDLIIDFIIKYKFVFLFYLLVIAFLIYSRKKLAVQAKIIFLYRMKWGLTWMDKYAGKFREWIILLGYIGVGAGYVGLIYISYVLIKNLYALFTEPSAVSGISLVFPGITVPGMGILPFWYWLLAIFIIALVHEFAHGIVARAHHLSVKNTGIAFFGPILGAFVEPDEKKIREAKDIIQYSVLAAGSFSNILLAIVAVLLLNLAFSPIQEMMVEPTGFTFDNYVDETLPFAKAGIVPGTVITGINNEKAVNFQEFNEELSFHRPGERITIRTPQTDYSIILAESPDNPKKGFLGIKDIHNEFTIKDQYEKGLWKVIYLLLNWFSGFFRWLFLLSLGIGLFNLLPLPIVDGGRMAQVFLQKLKGPEEGERRYKQISLFFLLILLLNLIFPIIIKLF